MASGGMASALLPAPISPRSFRSFSSSLFTFSLSPTAHVDSLNFTFFISSHLPSAHRLPSAAGSGSPPPPPFVYSIFHSYFIKEKTDRGESPLITQSLFWRLNFHCRVSAGSNAQASSAPPPPLLDPLSAV